MRIVNRLRYLVRRGRRERELEEEVAAHRAMLEDRGRRDGLSENEARAAASRLLGNSTLALEASRERWNFVWLESLLQDIHYALRCFSQAPLFAGTVILTISLALGLNTVLFTFFNAYVLAPFHVQDPYSLYEFWWNTKSVTGRGFSWQEFQQVANNNPVLSDVFAIRRTAARSNSDEFLGQLVSGNYFPTLGIAPEFGRAIEPSDAAAPGTNAVIVLSHAAWQSKFGGDPSVIGRKIMLRGYPFEIVGVARKGFAGILNAPTDFWAPLTMYHQLVDGADLFGAGDTHPLELIGRLNPGITTTQAQAELTVQGQELTAQRAAPDRVIGTGLDSRATTFELNSETIASFGPGVVAFGLVLLLGCANVANMMLARALARQREIAVRLALGAPRSRLIRQLLTEGFVLAIPSAGLAWLIAWLGARFGAQAFFAVIPSEFAKQLRVVPITVDWRVFSFVLLTACGSAVLFALPPALQATRTDLAHATRGELTERHRAGFLRDSLVVVQVVICVMLLVTTGIVLRTGQRVRLVDVGLDVRGTLEIRAQDQQRAKIAAALQADPAVESVAAVWRTPLYGSLRVLPVTLEGSSASISAGFNFVSPEYFDILRIPIEQGRNFTRQEALGGAPVIIVSETTAQKFWPGTNAVGQVLNILPARADARPDVYPRYSEARVIGVAGDIVNVLIRGVDPTCVYFPTNASSAAQSNLVVRVRGDAEIAAHDMETKLQSQLPGAVQRITPMQQVLDILYLPFRIFSWISAALGAIALALTAAGIYGVIAYLVGQRTKEVGIRMALGATSGSIAKLVLSESAKLALVGLTVGGIIAVIGARALAPVFVGLDVLDAPVYLATFAVVLLAALLAAAVPARRASRLDPMITLRHE